MRNKSITAVEAPHLREVPTNIRPGDVLEVIMKIQEGGKERLQTFEGILIGYKHRGIATSILLRKHSHDEGVERRIFVHSPLVHSIKRLKRGIVRRAKLYYLREREGKAARIKEKFESKSSSV
ncbi:MAG: 50S ribosomal protein L19 [Methylacidiphilales bacterium]|nr:50S ribosomal protein L19 [Candidatus Methylacidiphilales bacterium]